MSEYELDFTRSAAERAAASQTKQMCLECFKYVSKDLFEPTGEVCGDCRRDLGL